MLAKGLAGAGAMALRFVVAALVLAVWCDAAQSSGSRSRRKRQAAAREVRERKYQKKEQDLNTPLASAKSVTAAKSATAAAAAKVGTAGYTAKQLAAGGFSSKQLRKIARKELMEEQAREEHKEWMRYESRAIRSSNQQRFSLIPDKWGGNLDCDRPLRALDSQDSDELVVAIASDELDPLPIFAAINSTVSNYNFARDPDGVLPHFDRVSVCRPFEEEGVKKTRPKRVESSSNRVLPPKKMRRVVEREIRLSLLAQSVLAQSFRERFHNLSGSRFSWRRRRKRRWWRWYGGTSRRGGGRARTSRCARAWTSTCRGAVAASRGRASRFACFFVFDTLLEHLEVSLSLSLSRCCFPSVSDDIFGDESLV